MSRGLCQAGEWGVCSADEQGLGKTVQMLALIVTRGPTAADARKALDNAQRSQHSMELHPLGSAARLARAAQLGLPAPGSLGGTSASHAP